MEFSFRDRRQNVEHHREAESIKAGRLGAYLCFAVQLCPDGHIFSTGGHTYMKKIGIVMGSDSDLPVVQKCTDVLKKLEIPFEAHVYSAHRTPEEARSFAITAEQNDFAAVIAFAGMAAHLAGVIASYTLLPVIAVPCKGPVFDGMDALLSSVQMPSGIPVATVAVNAGANAALLAAQIIALSDADVYSKLKAMRNDSKETVLSKDRDIMSRL